ncbi:pimeloyl-ACP methyl ester carboxylesterase [Amycolatopsis lexingtonensis]|uniref:Pimeloyl-ACP methyl ester carboxylesterase n=1 Tax=Amycolatopsis lexingtonensis TaxID=218822 RepID=A0ABR9HUX5_9PSEU|nr:alpha/beta fold hydrolase [Amycolatopsis lexingtonensis]MBE1494733.1 pimeloyl-ACP methyl ester carboxylesterase [Amycolatopsis lexingtonensis]
MSRIRAGELDVHVQRLAAEAPLDGDAPLVVCVHGLLTDSLASYYFTLGPALAARGLDVLMYDLRGHGRTTRPASGYRLDQFVDDLVAVLDACGATRPVHVVGNSFGASVAFGLAAARPDRVASVIAIEGEPPTSAWTQHMADGLADAKTRLALDEVIGWIADNHGAHTARLSKAAHRILETTTIAEDVPRSATIAADLSAVRCPVFAIFGGDSGLAAQVPDFEANLARCRCAVLPDQGHSVLVERTAEVIDLVFEWVRDTSRAPARVR